MSNCLILPLITGVSTFGHKDAKIKWTSAVHKMKTLSPKIKIMFCSALDIAQELTSILPDIEHDHIIRKPVEREYFINKINSVVNKQ